MRKHNFEQGSDEWLEFRSKCIGGTDASGLRIKSDTLTKHKYIAHTEPFDPEDGYKSDAMEAGTLMEPIAREFLSEYLKMEFKEVGYLQHEKIDILGISPDGMTEDERFMCEIKCPKALAHLEICLSSEIPSKYIDQCVHYFTINPRLEKLYFLSYREEALKKHVIIELTRDSIVYPTKVGLKVSDMVEGSLVRSVEIEKEIKEMISKFEF